MLDFHNIRVTHITFYKNVRDNTNIKLSIAYSVFPCNYLSYRVYCIQYSAYIVHHTVHSPLYAVHCIQYGKN